MTKFDVSWIDNVPQWFNRVAHSLLWVISGALLGTLSLVAIREKPIDSIGETLLGFISGSCVLYNACLGYVYLSRGK